MLATSLHVLQHFIVPPPGRFFSAANSIITAGVFGAAYGLIGRVIYPKEGISPTNYAIWFALAFQIKAVAYFLGKCIEDYVREESEKVNGHPFLKKIYHLSNAAVDYRDLALTKIDRILSAVLHIRPYAEIKDIAEASFLEMCRYRVWKIFKTTILDLASAAIAYQLLSQWDFRLPVRATAQLFIIIEYFVFDILMMPTLYLYVRYCEKLADKMEKKDQLAQVYQATWLRDYLPAL